MYVWINRLNLQIHSVKIFIDNYIPFIKWMVIPYILWYLYIWFVIFYLAFYYKKLFILHTKGVILSKLICMVIYITYPTYVIRPEILGTDIFSKLIEMVYSNDNPVNVFPSIHVLQSLLTHKAIIHIKGVKKWVKYSSLLFIVMVILSTLMIKQHYILDVIGAYSLALITTKFIYNEKHEGYSIKTIKSRLLEDRF
ncbi:phosphatase PAP2 family protein [Thermohalobacter berrensis]|nr:phosphatase PAP2 family protein [Thermohalobacter berrensis]